MRCPSVALFMATLLVIADISFGSPANLNRHSDSISAHSVPVRSLTIPSSHAVAMPAAPKDVNSHLPHKRHKLDLSNRPSPALIQRHHHILEHLGLHTASAPSPPASIKRSLTSDLIVMGLVLIWDHADVIISSYLAHHRTTTYYQDLIRELGTEFSFGPTVQNHVIAYGCFRLTFSFIPSSDVREFAHGIGPFIREFASVMLLITSHVVMATYRVLAWSAMVSIWITMVIVENGQEPDVITVP